MLVGGSWGLLHADQVGDPMITVSGIGTGAGVIMETILSGTRQSCVSAPISVSSGATDQIIGGWG